MAATRALIPAHQIEQSIYLLRGQKVLLDFDLARLYGVMAKVLNQAVKRNAIRQLMAPPEKPRREIGFHVRERAPRYRTRLRR